MLNLLFEGAVIEQGAFEAHGITLERSITKGIPQWKLYNILKHVYDGKVRLVGHNLNFDAKFLHRFPKTPQERNHLIKTHHTGICTMKSSVNFCKLPPTKAMKQYKNWKNGKYKNPTLGELHQRLFKRTFDGAHDAMNDVNATFKSLKRLVKLGVIKL